MHKFMKRIFTVIGTLLGTMILFAQDIPKIRRTRKFTILSANWLSIV